MKYKIRELFKEKVFGKILLIDLWILLPVLFLLIFGLIFVYSSSANYAQVKGFSELFYFTSHFKKIILGLICLLITFYVPFEFWYRFSRPIGLLSLLLLIVLLIAPNSVSLNGAKRWLFGIQPSEFSKLGFILFFARKIVEKESVKGHLKQGFLGSLVVVFLFFILLVLQPDYSSGLIFLLIAFSMLFYGGFSLKHMVISVLILIPILSVFILIEPYRLHRIMSFFDPSGNYQSSQSLISLGSGGFLGAGMGEGTQKLGYLPMPFTDTTFSIIGEELGFFPLILFLGVFSLIIFKGFHISSKNIRSYDSLLVFGATISIMITAFMHIGVCIGYLPVTGQPLPFISYGGSALIVNLAFIGFILQGSLLGGKIKKIY